MNLLKEKVNWIHSQPLLWITSLVLLVPGSNPVAADTVEDCPYAKIGEEVIAGFSLESWDDFLELFGGSGADSRLIEVIREEVVPALLELPEEDKPEGANRAATLMDTLAETVNWERLRAAEVAGALWYDEARVPFVTVKLTPPDGTDVGDLLEDVSKIASGVAGQIGAASWEQDENRWLLVTTGENGQPDEPIEWISVEKRGGSLWLCVFHRAQEAEEGPGLSLNEEFVRLWKGQEQAVCESFVFNFPVLAELLRDYLAPRGPTYESSLVIDSTVEEQFKDNPEVLRMLREVQDDFGAIAPSGSSPGIIEAMTDVLKIVSDMGIVVTKTGPSNGHIASALSWRPMPGSEAAALLLPKPIPKSLLGLLGGGWEEISLSSLPDLAALYQKAIEMVGKAPEGVSVLDAWNAVQKQANFFLEKDLLPAVGAHTAFVVNRDPNAGGAVPGLQIMSSEVLGVLALDDLGTARRSLGRLEEIIEESGIPVSASVVSGATWTNLDFGLMGKGMWKVLEGAHLLLVTNAQSREFPSRVLTALETGLEGPPVTHKLWKEMEGLWSENPAGVSIQNLEAVVKDSLNQLRQARMMLSMMGDAGGFGEPLMNLGIGLMEEMDGLEWAMSVGSVVDGTYLERSKILKRQDPGQ